VATQVRRCPCSAAAPWERQSEEVKNVVCVCCACCACYVSCRTGFCSHVAQIFSNANPTVSLHSPPVPPWHRGSVDNCCNTVQAAGTTVLLHCLCRW
jgi:hypothetical protein